MHVGGGGKNGLLPSKPTLVIGQPVAVDPSRAPTASGTRRYGKRWTIASRPVWNG